MVTYSCFARMTAVAERSDLGLSFVRKNSSLIRTSLREVARHPVPGTQLDQQSGVAISTAFSEFSLS
jgi:hypothetical protein